MNELAIAALRFGLLLALWILIVSIVTSQGRDLVVGRKNKMRLQQAQHQQHAPSAPPAGPVSATAATPASLQPPAAGSPAPGAPATPAPAPTTPAPKLARRLRIVAGPASGTVVDLEGVALLMGRAQDADLVLEDDYASGRHARLFPQGTRWFLEDLGSTNGTYVDESAVTRAQVITPQNRVRIGKTVMELEA